MGEHLELIGKSLQAGNSGDTRKNVVQAIEAGVSYQEILVHMLYVMEIVGKAFKENKLFVPEVLIIGRAFNVALDVISPMITEKEIYNGTVVIGTVKGDLHDIGKNLVKMLMSSTGTKVIDLGVDVSPERFIKAIQEHKPDVVAMSALLTTTMVQINQTIKEIKKSGLRDDVLILIGGAPVTSNYAKNVGADYFALDAGTAADIVHTYLLEKKAKTV